MDALQQRYIKLTFRKLTHPEISRVFEQKLADLAPDFLPVQQPLEILARFVQHLDDPVMLHQLVQEYTTRYPIYQGTLPMIRDAMCWTIRQHLEFTPKIQQAWDALYVMMAEIMRDQAGIKR
jgi:hypothetical protein